MNQLMGLKSGKLGFLKGDFLKNVSLMMSGTIVAQLITVLTAPVLTRLYEADALGVYSMYVSIISVWSVAAAFRYELAIVLPRDERDGDGLFLLSSLSVLLMSAICCAVVFAAGPAVSERMGVPELTPWLAWIPCSLLAMGLYQNLNYWSTRNARFKRLSLSQAVRSVAVSAMQLAAGFFGIGTVGLIGGHFAGQSAASAVLGLQGWRECGSRLKRAMSWRHLRSLARQYAEFPLYSTPQALLNALSQNLPVFMLAIFYDTRVVAFYAISIRLLQLPVTLVSQSVRQVFLQQASEAKHDGDRAVRMFRKLTLTLAMLAAVPLIVLTAFGPPLFQAVLGPEWHEAGQYARWMAVWLFFAFVNPPANVLSTVFGMQRMLLAYECALLAFRFGALYVGGLYLNPLGCVAVYSIVGAVFNLFLILGVQSSVRKKARMAV
ncbi:lipopolysaccharide biosynthesis protein [Cohnella caldifontis]|uniref:lipopolysaccharide biosynthesis protein n=1 Tax=Cohnella caldifontis TaxID=3027471 RepID=UPI0023EDEE71|nr:oligosaccharide flippase family protein [Cohnella sp. YIM B05605]